jgi:hypothetical protein
MNGAQKIPSAIMDRLDLLGRLACVEMRRTIGFSE